MGVLNGLLNLFIYCYFAYKPAEYYIRAGDLLYDVDWIKLPPNLQKYFILMIQDAQIPIFYHGFHIIDMHFETFVQVI